MIKLLSIFKRFLPFLPYILIAGVCFYFIHSYTSLQDTNRVLESEVKETQLELKEIKQSYAKQQELIKLQQELASDLEQFREESHRRTLDYLTESKEIGNEIKDDPISVLHPDVSRMLNEYTNGINTDNNNP